MELIYVKIEIINLSREEEKKRRRMIKIYINWETLNGVVSNSISILIQLFKLKTNKREN